MKYFSFALIATFSFVLACTSLPDTAKPRPVLRGDCRADQLQDLVGQNIALSNLSELPQPLRVIRPGQPVTMDYNLGRLNVSLDEADVIVRMYCG